MEAVVSNVHEFILEVWIYKHSYLDRDTSQFEVQLENYANMYIHNSS